MPFIRQVKLQDRKLNWANLYCVINIHAMGYRLSGAWDHTQRWFHPKISLEQHKKKNTKKNTKYSKRILFKR